jgi:hypothetical protein
MGSGFGFDVGLGTVSGSTNVKSGVNAGKPGAPPTVMDIVEKIGVGIVKSYAIKAAIGATINAIVPGTTAAIANAWATGEGIIGGATAVADTLGLAASAAGTNIAAGASSAMAATGFAEAGTALAAGEFSAALAAVGPAGWAVLAAVAIFSIFGFGGSSSPPPKEPKFHAAIYVTGNNNINAIAPMLETQDYHAVPDAYKTLAYGLVKVAFNAVKEAEAISKVASPFDYIYMKVEFNRIAMSVGVGAPNAKTLGVVGANEIYNYDTPPDKMQVNTLAKGVVDAIIAEFKRGTSADAKGQETLDLAAKKISGYNLNELSSGLVSDLTTGTNKLNTGIEKGIFAPSVAESNRISSLILAATSKAAYITDSEGNTIVSDTIPEGGSNMVYSMKQGKFVNNPYGLDTILLDQNDRPVYNIEGTSAGLTIDDFSSADVVGANRPANVLNMQAPTAASSASGGGVVISAPTTSTVDNKQIITYVSSQTISTDSVRNAATQVGVG